MAAIDLDAPAENVLIAGNRIEEFPAAIKMGSNVQSLIENNQFYRNGLGVKVEHGAEIQFRNNSYRSNELGDIARDPRDPLNLYNSFAQDIISLTEYSDRLKAQDINWIASRILGADETTTMAQLARQIVEVVILARGAWAFLPEGVQQRVESLIAYLQRHPEHLQDGVEHIWSGLL